MSSFYTTCAKCGDEIGSAHKILWLAAGPFHSECATEHDRTRERDAAVAELLEAAKQVTGTDVYFGTALEHLEQAIANYVRLISCRMK